MIIARDCLIFLVEIYNISIVNKIPVHYIHSMCIFNILLSGMRVHKMTALLFISQREKHLII